MGFGDYRHKRSGKKKQEKYKEVKSRLLETIYINELGRYEVKLPWQQSRDELETNYDIARKI